MKDLQKIITFIRKRLPKPKLPHRAGITKPRRDWLLLLGSFVLLLVLFSLFNAYVFVRVGSGDLFMIDSRGEGQVETLDRKLLKETLVFFEEKERIGNELRSNPPVSPDPSSE